VKLPIKWLKEYVDTRLSAEKIADKLTMAGLEVEEIVGGTNFSGVVVGHVLEVVKHPNADKLHVARVQISPNVIPAKAGIQRGIGLDSSSRAGMTSNDEGILQIVCGASNLVKGQKVPVALVGAKLGDFEIGKATLRGIDSFGMICSERELGISDKHEGIMVLPATAEIGSDVSLLLGSEKVLDVKVLANRPDCMSIIGLAREVAVTTGSSLKTPVIPGLSSSFQLPPTSFQRRLESRQTADSPLDPSLRWDDGEEIDVSVSVEDAKLCPRYMARFVTNLKKTETPAWMQERLIACGVRPISLFVDISNYVMLEYGQPLHFFDLDKLNGSKVSPVILNEVKDLEILRGSQNDKGEIVVRQAKAGETLVTLDGIKRKLTPDNLVIANSKVPIALAGVMGGMTTEIDDKTQNILIEAAIFDKASIRRTSRALGLRSEAVARFEKGIAQMLPEVTINRAVQLLQELGGGKISKTVVDIYPSPEKPKTFAFDVWKMNTFLGTATCEQEATDVLSSLGFSVTKGKNGYDVVAPFWRRDILEDVDIYEEVIRIVGYDKVPYTLPFAVNSVPEINNYYKASGQIRNHLASIGFTEVLTYSFIGAKELSAIGVSTGSAPEIQNPLVADQQYLRPTLVPKMLEALRDNQYNKDVLRFFEIGKSFVKVGGGKLPLETNWLILGLNTDYYDAKGAVYNLLANFGITEDEIVVKPTTVDFLKKGIGADLFTQGKKLAIIGEIREPTKLQFDLKRSATIALLDIDTLLSLELPEVKFMQFSKFQQVTRDVSALFDTDTTAAEIRQKLARAAKLVTKVEIIDIYSGKGMETGKKSVTIRLYIQSDDHTLTDKEVDDTIVVVHNKVTEIGGKLRSGN